MDLGREEIALHLTNDCPKREVVCQHCKKGFASDSIEVSQPLWFLLGTVLMFLPKKYTIFHFIVAIGHS